MDRIPVTMVPWRHLVNDTDLCRSPISPKKSIKPYFGVQGHSRLLNSVSIESQYTTFY